MAILIKRLRTMAGILASVATIGGVIVAVVKSNVPITSTQMSLRDARADNGSQIIQNNGGNVSIGQAAPSNPREILARSGTQWSFSDFDEAFDNNDERVVGLFLAGGMALRSYQLENFVKRVFQPGMAIQLIRGIQADQPGLCLPNDGTAVSLYEAASDDQQKRGFLRKLCAGPRVKVAIEEKLDQAKKNVETMRQKNAVSESAKNACIQSMHRIGQSKLIRGVVGKPLLEQDFAYSEMDFVETELSRRIFFGATHGSWFDTAIQDGCSHAHPTAAVDDIEVRQWRGVLVILGE